MTEQVIQLEKVNKWYDDFHVLKDIDLSVENNDSECESFFLKLFIHLFVCFWCDLFRHRT